MTDDDRQQTALELAWRTFLTNAPEDKRSAWEAFFAGWHAGRTAEIEWIRTSLDNTLDKIRRRL